jgi:hypothetical protein
MCAVYAHYQSNQLEPSVTGGIIIEYTGNYYIGYIPTWEPNVE